MWQRSSIWRNLHGDIKININYRFAKLLKLRGDQKIFDFGGERGGCHLSRMSESFLFQRGACSTRGEG